MCDPCPQCSWYLLYSIANAVNPGMTGKLLSFASDGRPVNTLANVSSYNVCLLISASGGGSVSCQVFEFIGQLGLYVYVHVLLPVYVI